jgi:hypothetical protein
MPQPDYVPMTRADEVRQAERMPVPGTWVPNRPGEVWDKGMPTGKRVGAPGPDQGYGLKLARQFLGRLQLADGELADDAVAGCLTVGLKRASRFGRAPVIHDMELAFVLWGFLGDPPAALIEYRKPLFMAVSHDYWEQRAIADAVPDETLRLTAADVRSRLADWRSLISVP